MSDAATNEKDEEEQNEQAEASQEEKGEEGERVEEYDEQRALSFMQEVRAKESHLPAPIELNISGMARIKLSPLAWCNHDAVPKKIKIANTGCTVIYSAKWQRETPHLLGGPFHGKCVFSQLHFHWGENEMTGSEHRLDASCAPMELHALHDYASEQDAAAAKHHPDGLAILVYLLALQPSPNPHLASIVAALPEINEAGSSTRIDEMQPLMNILRPFENDYFVYYGALAEGARVTWLVCREPIGVAQEQVRFLLDEAAKAIDPRESIKQIGQFRKLQSKRGGPVISNLSELQERQGRHVFHVNPSGRANSTLLWIPRGPPMLAANPISTAED